MWSRRVPNQPSDSVGTTPWRLCDPALSHWGLWRADLGPLPPEVEGFRNRAVVKKYIQKLLDDWALRSARGGRAIRIFGELTRSRGPFEDDSPGSKVYRITLKDDDKTRRTGWLRLGTGWVEFQVERSRREPGWYREITYQTESAGPPLTADRRVSSPLDPMWDRWLDG